VRENGGGDDDMWKQGLMRYIADKPYRHTSTYIKKVIEGRQNATEKVGDVISGTIENWEQPDLNNPLHYSGKIYVLTGRTSYSSAIVFGNTMQDFKFGTLVGAGGYARVRSSGGIQEMILPNTGLSLIVPRFIIDRPSGVRDPALVRPDMIIADNPFNSRALIDTLHARIVAGKP
jgi:C-terminal processing protease CtpA/Prc